MRGQGEAWEEVELLTPKGRHDGGFSFSTVRDVARARDHGARAAVKGSARRLWTVQTVQQTVCFAAKGPCCHGRFQCAAATFAPRLQVLPMLALPKSLLRLEADGLM